MPDNKFTMDDVSKALAIALLTNHGLAYRNPIPTVADAALAPKATQGPKLKSVTSSPDSGWFSGQVQASTTPQWPPGHSSEPKAEGRRQHDPAVITSSRSSLKGPKTRTRNSTKCVSHAIRPIAVTSISRVRPQESTPQIHGRSHKLQHSRPRAYISPKTPKDVAKIGRQPHTSPSQSQQRCDWKRGTGSLTVSF